jgi:glycine/D-amino acid oxidase-like deaminating enzyme
MRWQGLGRLRELLGDASIGYEPLGGYEIFTDADLQRYEKCREKMDGLNRRMKEITGEDGTYETCDDRIDEFGFAGVRHLIHNRLEGQIDTGAMMQALMEKAKRLGIGLFTGVEVEHIEHSSDGVLLVTKNGFRLPARRLLLATNGFAARLFPELQVDPARAQVLVTRPVKGLKLKGSFHYEEGYYYFRNIGDRILLGGGRNLDFSGETTTHMELTDLIQKRLQEMLSTMICPYSSAEIDMRWSGIMGMGPVKSPIIRRIDDRTVCAVRMGGMGVAIGSLVGEKAADLLLETL